jgi:hypothetical protein
VPVKDTDSRISNLGMSFNQGIYLFWKLFLEILAKGFITQQSMIQWCIADISDRLLGAEFTTELSVGCCEM